MQRRQIQSGDTRAWMGAKVAAALAGMVLALASCANAPRPVSKIVNGRLIVSRAVTPEAYERVSRALLYEQEGRWEEAARELQRALPFDDEAAELRAHLADLLLRLGRIDDAADQIQRSLAIADTVEGRLAAAHLAETRHDQKGALTQYQTAAALAGSEPNPGPEALDAIERTHLALADAHLTSLNVASAYETVRALRSASAESVRARIELAAQAWALARFSDAEGALAEALRLEPAELDGRLMMAALLVASGKTAQAKAAFREALARSEDAVEIAEMFLKWLVARGDESEAAEEAARLVPDVIDDNTYEVAMRIERAAGRTEQVKSTADRALKAGAPAARVAMLVAGALLDGKDRTGAAARLETVGHASPDFIESRLRIAEALREESDARQHERARRALAEAAAAAGAESKAATSQPASATGASPSTGVSVSPSPESDKPARDWKVDLIVASALLEEKRGDAIRAARTLDEALEKDPGNARLLLVRAAVDERRGEWRNALTFAEKILAADPRNVEALNFHGFVSVEHDDNLPMATRRLQVAMALDPGAGGIVDSLGWAYLRGGDLDRATEFLTQADRLEPGDPEILSHLAELWSRKRDIPRAIAIYRRALQNDPSERLAREISDRLRELEAKSAAGR